MQVPNPEAIMLFRCPAATVQILAGIAFGPVSTAAANAVAVKDLVNGTSH